MLFRSPPKCAWGGGKCAEGPPKCAWGGGKCAEGPPKCAEGLPKCVEGPPKCAEGLPKCAEGPPKWCAEVLIAGAHTHSATKSSHLAFICHTMSTQTHPFQRYFPQVNTLRVRYFLTFLA